MNNKLYDKITVLRDGYLKPQFYRFLDEHDKIIPPELMNFDGKKKKFEDGGKLEL